MAVVELEIPPRSIYVGVVRLAVASLGRAAGLSEDTVDDLKIATSEACANAVLGVEGSGSAATIAIGWDEDQERIVVTIVDPSPSPGDDELDVLDSQGLASRRAMSEALLGSLVDEVTVTAHPSGGSETKLVVSRRST